MNYHTLIETLSPEIYRNLMRAVELGKWPDGRALTPDQRQTCMQAMIAWGKLNLPEREQIGYIDLGHKAGDVCDDLEATPLSWRD